MRTRKLWPVKLAVSKGLPRTIPRIEPVESTGRVFNSYRQIN